MTSDPSAVASGPRQLAVFVRGPDNALWYRAWNGAAWSGWHSLGGGLGSAPEAASWGPNRIDVFVQGTDTHLWHIWSTGSGWSGWESRGGILTSSPEAASWGPNRLDVYVLGVGNVMYQQFWNGSSWTPWGQVDSHVWSADPGAVGRLPQTIDLVERGTDGAAWLREISG